MGIFRNKKMETNIENNRLSISDLQYSNRLQQESNHDFREHILTLKERLERMERRMEVLSRDNLRYRNLLKQLGQAFWENEAVMKTEFDQQNFETQNQEEYEDDSED